MSPRLRNVLIFLSTLVMLLGPFAVWQLWRPIRAIKPEWAGVVCYAEGVCIDNPLKAEEARLLKRRALAFMTEQVGKFEASPRMIFCTTSACETSFGFKGNAAYNVGTLALVVSSRGWKTYYIQHELIHCVQVERIGGLRMLLHTPTWLIEGMAYSLSGDPRRPLKEPWETYRKSYEQWAELLPPKILWAEAAAL